jgi:hypothetical protein
MKRNLNLYQILWGIVIFAIGSVLVIHNSNWYTFLGVFLLLWSNNIGLRIDEVQNETNIFN